MRMLRVSDTDAIRNPELLPVHGGEQSGEGARGPRPTAGQQRRHRGRQRAAVARADFAAGWKLDTPGGVARLHEVLMQLPPKCRAAVVLHYRDDWPYQQIADELKVSSHMVKKYLTQALGHCRRRMARLG